MSITCKHERRELIARRDGVDYERCLDCDQVLEADDLDGDTPLEGDDENELA
jgi:hypothetical protein